MTADLLRLADVVLKVSVLMGAAALTTRALARRSAAARHLVWTFAISAALAMPILTSVVPRVERGGIAGIGVIRTRPA